MDHLAHQSIGVVASKLFLEPMSVPQQICDHSQSIVSGTTILVAHPTSVDASQQPPLEIMLHSQF
jgi:hypothetical protein